MGVVECTQHAVNAIKNHKKPLNHQIHSLTFRSINLFNGSYHCIKNIPVCEAPHKYLYPLYGFLATQHFCVPLVSGTRVVNANFLGTNRSGIRFICKLNRCDCLLCNASKSCRYSCGLFPDNVIKTSLITYIHTVLRLYNWSMHVSCNSFKFKLYMPSSAPISICWSLVSGWIHEAVQCIRNGQPLNTLEKHAPICTFGVGGKPLLGGLGGVCLRRCFLGGTGGHATKSGAVVSWLLTAVSLTKNRNSNNCDYLII